MELMSFSDATLSRRIWVLLDLFLQDRLHVGYERSLHGYPRVPAQYYELIKIYVLYEKKGRVCAFVPCIRARSEYASNRYGLYL